MPVRDGRNAQPAEAECGSQSKRPPWLGSPKLLTSRDRVGQRQSAFQHEGVCGRVAQEAPSDENAKRQAGTRFNSKSRLRWTERDRGRGAIEPVDGVCICG